MAKKDKVKKEFFLKRFFKSIVSFISGSIAELKKVVWPSKKELTQQTGIVIVVVAVVAAYIWVLDTIFGFLKNLV